MASQTSKDEDSYEPIGPSGSAPPPPPPNFPSQPPPPPDFRLPPLPPPQAEMKRNGLKSRTKTLDRFALRPGDDVDLSSDHDRTGGAASSDEKLSKSIDKFEKDKKLGEKHFTLDIKPYKEPTMLKVCHIVTLVLLVLSFLLMALTVVQFVDIFVWLPLLVGETA
ncbi:unnamed protein product [Cylicostephanus goldi]|uniref:Uncharacterized protein n=1 Tax=Cylicostephanus goldi TaxID=71465 RepID=A0A3P7MVN7_CYLGO|nr:unnamed protein product [Cylicostephanus goldi]